MLFTAEHDEIRRSLQKFIANEINPHVDEWEKAEIFPAHELFRKMGSLGFLGLNKPVAFGGSGLDYSYALMMAEELGKLAEMQTEVELLRALIYRAARRWWPARMSQSLRPWPS